MKAFTLFFLLFSSASSLWSATDLELIQLHRDYAQALAMDGEQDERQAILAIRQAYQKHLRNTEHPSSALHYNLGTLHLKLEEYGPAIYHLKLAHLKDPNDSRVVDHLRRASRQAGVSIVEKDQTLVGGWVQDTWKALSLPYLMGLLVLMAILGLILVLLAPAPKKLRRWWTMSFFLVCMTFITLLRQSGWGLSREVVLLEAFNPRSGVGLAYPGILDGGQLKGGHVGTLMRHQTGWVEVKWYESGKGWVPAEKVSEVSY